MKHTLIERDHYNITGEFLWFGVILHSDVYRWSPKIKLRFLSDLQSLVRAKSPLPCYSFVRPSEDNNKLRKFIRSVGGHFHHLRKATDGEEVELYLFPRSLRPI